MTYTQLAVIGLLGAVLYDMAILRTAVLGRRAFWVAYAIMVTFQLLSNGVLTGLRVVRYSADSVAGVGSLGPGTPPFIGSGRIFFAPVEDLVFGFSLIVFTLATWVWLGRRGLQPRPLAGPPRWRDPASAPDGRRVPTQLSWPQAAPPPDDGPSPPKRAG